MLIFFSAWSAFFPIKAATRHSTGTFNIYVADLCGKTSFCRTCAHTISQQNKTAAACLMVRLKRSRIHSVFHHAYTATNDDLDTFHIIFMIVLFSNTASGLNAPMDIGRKLDMLDKTADVMKTFNDYSEEADIQFIQLTIPENHLWCGHKLKDLTLPPETLIVLIRRGEQNIIPDGETIILQNDVLVLSAITPDEVHGIKLVEKIIEKDSRYNNKLLSEISKKHNEIIIMIQRNGQVIIPNGNVRLTTGDILVINRAVN